MKSIFAPLAALACFGILHPLAHAATATRLKDFEGVEEPEVKCIAATGMFERDKFINITDSGPGVVRMTLRYSPEWWDGDRTNEDKSRQRAEVKVDPACFGTTVTVHAVTSAMKAHAATRLRSIAIQQGEFELLAFVITQDPNALILSSTDRAAVMAGCELGLSNRFRSLEQLVNRGRVSQVKFPDKCTEKWLSAVKTKFESGKGR